MKPGLLLLGGLLLIGSPTAAQTLPTSAAVKKLFLHPPRQYSSAPLWVWNDMLTEEQVRGTLRDLAGQKVRQAFLHPRPGLMTPYLSPEWFRLWKIALDEAEKLDMNIWIYDENSYPSGFAGGFVPELMPESRGRGLVFEETATPAKVDKNLVALYRLGKDGFENVTAAAQKGQALPPGRYLAAKVQRAPNSPWHGDRCYVDLMYPGVTQKFLEVTLEAYRREIGASWGQRVLGSFTDEPEINPAGGLPWTDHLPAAFEKRWGYRLTDRLPSLNRPVGNWKQVRHDYFQVLLEQFIYHWARPYYDYCAKHGLAFTGHYWDHEWPNATGVPDNMAMSAWQQLPGIDCLMNLYQEDTRAQFGNVRMVRELGSVANQLGRSRRLCEIYGAGGWDLRFEDMKRIADWLGVLGVNLFDEHLSYVTLRGARKADHPQSFSYHEPWWDSYHVVAEYLTRLSTALSQGEQVNRILVLQPTATAWMYQADPSQAKHLGQIGKSFFDLLLSLERAQVEYDIGCEDIIARHGSVPAEGKATFQVARRGYEVVVLPPDTETLGQKTMAFLEQFQARGGRVILCGPAPDLVDARPSDRGKKLAGQPNCQQVNPSSLAAFLAPSSDGFAIDRTPEDRGNLFHQRRQLIDGELLFLVNTSIEQPSSGRILTPGHGIEAWNLRTGQVENYPFQVEGAGVRAGFQLPPCGSLLLFLAKENRQAGKVAPQVKGRDIAPASALHIRRLEPNVLTLDYVDITAGGETQKNIYHYAANQLAWVKNGMPRNPWDSAVQFRDELISKKFPPHSGFEATYRFTVEGPVPKPLIFVLERPDLYTISCNGVSVGAQPGAWWLDRSFGKIDLNAAARTGDNAVTIKARPFTIYHELQPAYLLGDFHLRPTDRGFVVGPPESLKMARMEGGGKSAGLGWNRQGHPFYAAGVAYSQTFTLDKPSGSYFVEVPDWYGTVAKIVVNGRLCGHLLSQPWKCEVTSALKPGVNTVEVVVIGSLANLLGPHHAGGSGGSAWPGMFHQGPRQGPPPGTAYRTFAYGLFNPFRLVRNQKGSG